MEHRIAFRIISKILPKASRVYLALIALSKFLRKSGIRAYFILVSASLSVVSALLDGAAFGLLIPTIKGIMLGDFGFVKQIPVLNIIPNAFPGLFGTGNAPLFLFLISLIFIVISFNNVFIYVSSITVSFMIRRLSNHLRQRIYGRYLRFGKLFFDLNNQGRLYQILFNYTERIADEVIKFHQFSVSFFQLIIYLGIMAAISWQLTAFVLITSPFLYMASKTIIGRIKISSQLLVQSYGVLGLKLFNTLSCIPIIKSCANEESESALFRETSNRIEKVQLSIDIKKNLIEPINELLTATMALMLVGVATYLFLKRHSGNVAGFLVFFILLRRLIKISGAFNVFLASLASLRGPAGEVAGIFDNHDKHFIDDGGTVFTGLKHGIDLAGIGFSYIKGAPVLTDVNLFIEKGRRTALVGSTGGGKSTIINLIMRFYDCETGSLKIDGVDIRHYSLASLYSKIALVPQETYLFNASIKYNIIYGLKRSVSDEELAGVTRKARLYDFIMALPDRFETEIGDRGARLSGGEKQRLAIARAILKNPDILILDEATSSLDSGTERLIQEAIQEAASGKTAIVIAHRFSTIKNADKIVVLENGRIIEEGTMQGLMEKKGKFYFLHNEQKFY